MIPDEPLNAKPESREEEMFYALRDHLPEDYYVFHSFKLLQMNDDALHEREMDFLIYNKNKGIMILEAKAGKVYFDPADYKWHYGNGTVMKRGGPFRQADTAKWDLHDEIDDRPKLSHLVRHCKFCHAVWFPGISEGKLKNMILPPDILPQLILTSEALDDPAPYIERIFAIPSENGIETALSEEEHKEMLFKVLCPKFEIMPTATTEMDLQKVTFRRMLREQQMILNFLSEQRSAVINGPAGSGKTLIAVEKARRHSANGEKVLFLCFNSFLRQYLDDNFRDPNIDFKTVAEYACKVCRTPVPDYKALRDRLDDYYMEGDFPYKHIIIDEGQDFGSKEIVANEIMDMLRMIAEANEDGGSFYVFYDRLQFVQGKKLPKFLSDADCKMTLYKNCRNTENIAVTSLRPITERNPLVYEGAVKGDPAKILFCTTPEEQRTAADYVVSMLKKDGIDDAVILTCKTEDQSVLASETQGGRYKKKYRFTTCRKFKGLEADAVIITDVDRDTFSTEVGKQLFYVGTSRARFRLYIIAELTDDDCKKVLTEDLGTERKIKRPKAELAGRLNVISEKLG